MPDRRPALRGRVADCGRRPGADAGLVEDALAAVREAPRTVPAGFGASMSIETGSGGR